MSEQANGIAEIQKVLDLFKVKYQADHTFDQLRFGDRDAMLPVDFSFVIGSVGTIIEYRTKQAQAKEMDAILGFAQTHSQSLLFVDYRDDDNVQAVVSKFIDDVRSSKSEQTLDYGDYSQGYIYKPEKTPSPKTSAQKTKSKITEDQDFLKIKRENEKYQKEIADYQKLLTNFADQIKELNEIVTKNNQKILEIQSGRLSELTTEFDGDFREKGTKKGHLTDAAKRLVYVVTTNLNCNWVEVQRYFLTNYNESISISTIKRIYRQKNAEDA